MQPIVITDFCLLYIPAMFYLNLKTIKEKNSKLDVLS